MATNVQHLLRTIETLRQALDALESASPGMDSIRYDLFRNAAIKTNRNTTAHDYGVGFANETLILPPAFIRDAEALATALKSVFDEHGG